VFCEMSLHSVALVIYSHSHASSSQPERLVALQVEIEVFHGFLFMESTRCVISVIQPLSFSASLDCLRCTAHQRILITASCHDLNTGLTTDSALFSFMPPRLPPCAFVRCPSCRRELWRLPLSGGEEGMSVSQFRFERGEWDRERNGRTKRARVVVMLGCESGGGRTAGLYAP
jgi:hypothetical protein